MRLIIDAFYRLRSGSVGRYLGTSQGLRAFSVGGRRVEVRKRQVEALVAAPVQPDREPAPRRIPMKAESKRPVSSRRTEWARTKPGRRLRVKNGDARNSGGRCVCGACRLNG